ncbi:replication initiation protein [Azohydromonas aeria]|uniref:replication initiation protein n=1 Tax=Azohydromonas aeria TaxID=2590212 RepID=UPI0012FC497C|nr:replication initiation protein [Azohydromonas aeria]
MAEIKPVGEVGGEQYALLLFEETIGRKGRTATIADAESDIAFPKNNVFVDISEVGVLTRRGLNVMHYLACNAPLEQMEFDCDIDLFKFLINYASRNHKHLKDALREAQKTSIVVTRERADGQPGNGDFVSIPLVGMVGMANGRVYFKFDPAIRKLHKDPRGYTLLSLRTTSAFTSAFAHSLYEKLKSMAYRGSPTEWLTLEEARAWMGAQSSKYMDEFKQFRRFGLAVALAQINEFSDLHVEYETRNVPGSKKVSHIRFVFREQEGSMVAAQALHQTEARKTLYDILRGEFGIGSVDIQAITANSEQYTPERLQAAIDFVRHRIATARGKKIQYPGRLLMKALEEGWTVPTAELAHAAAEAQSPVPASAPAPAAAPAAAGARRARAGDERESAAQRHEYELAGEEGFKQYTRLGGPQREELWASFARTAHFKVLAAQLQLDRHTVPYESLVINERLRHALGKHVLDAQKKAARKPRATAQTELGLD